MRQKWVTDLDNLGRRKTQFQLAFPFEDEVYIYRKHTPYGHGIDKYMLLLPSLNKIWVDTQKFQIGTYHIDKMIERASDEEDLIRIWKDFLKEKVIDAL